MQTKPPAAGRGRKAGSHNKTTLILKEAAIMAAEQAGGKGGLVAYLKKQAIDTPGPFLGLLGKILPLQVTGANGGPVVFRTIYEAAPPELRLEAERRHNGHDITDIEEWPSSDGSGGTNGGSTNT